MKDEKNPPVEEYYCKKCKVKFAPAYYPVSCANCGGDKVVPYKSLRIPNRDWRIDPSIMDDGKKNKDKRKDE